MARLPSAFVASFLWGAVTAAPAQVFVNASAAEALDKSLAADAEPLPGCVLSKIDPQLTYSLAMESGYTVRVPLAQFAGRGNTLSVLLRITRRPDGQTVWLVRTYALPDVPGTNSEGRFWGRFRIREGVYDVAATAFDDRKRVSRAQWRIEVKPAPNVSRAPAAAAGPACNRLTVFLHAAPLNAVAPALRPRDLLLLTDALASLARRVPARRTRLVMFNLDLEKEFLRQEDFRSDRLEEVAQRLVEVQPGLVHRSALRRGGHLKFLAGLIERERREKDPPDGIVFLGPPGLTRDRVTDKEIGAGPTRGPRVFYVQLGFRAPAARMMPSIVETQPPGYWPEPLPPGGGRELFNTIRLTVKALHGKTYPVWTAGDFARAVERIRAALAGR